MNLPKKRTKKSCPIFGHECPGREEQVKDCLEKENFLNKEISKRSS